MRRRAIVAAACAALAVVPTSAPADPGPPIASLTVTSNGPITMEATSKILGLEVGHPIDRAQIRDAILAMYASTDAEWVRIEAADGPDGLEVVVRVSVRPTIEKIAVEVGNRVLRKRIEKWLEISVGDVVTEAGIAAGRRRIVRHLRDRGYPDPEVEIYLDYRRAANTVVLTVATDLGEPMRVGVVRLSGIDDPAVVALATPTISPGRKLDLQLEEKIRREVETRLRQTGYWEAEVLRLIHHGDGAEVDVEVVVAPGERYSWQVEHPPETKKAVLDAIPDPAQEEIHPQQTDALAERIRERLQQAGFLLAEVEVALVNGADGPVIRVQADPGVIRRVHSIEFPGASSLTTKLLASRLTVRSGAVRGLRGQDLSMSSLERDRLALLDLYRSMGFPEAAIATPRIEAEGADAARVVFEVDEGQRWFLTDLRIEGLPSEAAAALEKNPLPIEEATPWDPRKVEEARRRLEGLLADTGYPDGRVEAEIDANRLGDARVALLVKPGGYVRIGTIVIAGLESTRESVVRRMLRRSGIREGEPYSRARMLTAQQQLYELALFRRVELLPMPGQERHADRGIVVLIEEGLHKSYLVGLGWNETDRIRATLGWYHLNLFGGAHAFSVETVLSSTEQRYQLGIREPRLPKINLPGYLVVYRTFENFATYSQRRRGLWIDIGDRYKRPYRWWLRYEYQIVQPEDVRGEIGREEEEARISSITPTFEWDFRDSPLVPTRGTYSEVSLDYAFPLFQADSEFLKLQARTTLYGPIANGRGAVGIRIGAMQPLGSDTGVAPNLRIPLNTRFFAGGANTHRAFARDYLGIPGQTLDADGEPLGGNALLLLNAEYVRKIAWLVSGHIFVDAGNVWESPGAVRLGDIRWGAGLGLALDTPAGPIRVEYGWKLDRKEGEDPGRLWLSFGIPF